MDGGWGANFILTIDITGRALEYLVPDGIHKLGSGKLLSRLFIAAIIRLKGFVSEAPKQSMAELLYRKRDRRSIETRYSAVWLHSRYRRVPLL